MTTGFLQKIFGSRNQRLIKQYQKTVVAINALEPKIEQYTDEQLRAKTALAHAMPARTAFPPCGEGPRRGPGRMARRRVDGRCASYNGGIEVPQRG